jgi:fibronectin-binding autotransporter adhesin
MKTRILSSACLSFPLACALAALLAMPSTHADTYTWDNSNVTGAPVSALDWFTGGPNTLGVWTGPVVPASSNGNTIRFFADTSTALTNTDTPSLQTSNINNGAVPFELGALTLSGLASATTDANLTMTLTGDPLNFSAATGTINLDALNATQTIAYNLGSDIQLGTAGSAGALTVTGDGTGTFSIGGAISELQAGGGSLAKSGSSTLTLSGTNTFTGGTTLTSGTLNINSVGVAATSGPLGNGGTFTINGGTINNTSGAAKVLLNLNPITVGGNFAFSTSAGTATTNLTLPGAISMAADRTVTLNGLGALTLSGLLTNTVDSVRTLTVNNGSGTGATSLLTIGSYNLTGPGSSGVRTNIINGTGNVTISGVVGDGVSALSGLTYSGSGTLKLSGTNTFTGQLTVQSGTLSIATANNVSTNGPLGNSTLPVILGGTGAQTGTLRYTGGTATSTKPFTMATDGAGEFNVNANTLTLSGLIDGGGALTKTGAGTLTLSNTSNSYSGGTVINAGTLIVSSNSHLGAADGGITFNGSATLTPGQPSFSSARSITINNNAIATFGRADNTATFTGNLTGTGGIAMASSSTTQVIFNGTSNTFEGKIAIGGDGTANKLYRFAFASLTDSVTANGRIVFSHSGASALTGGNGSVFEYTGSADLVLDNRQIELASVANPTNGHQIRSNGGGTLTVNTDLIVSTAVAQTLALRGTNTANNAFAGKIGNGSGTVSLLKSDAGLWILSGANTYTGATTINAGTLLVNGNQSSATGNVAVNGTSTLGGSGTIGGTVTVAAAGKLAPGGTSAGTLSILGGLDISALAAGVTGKLSFELDALANPNDKLAVTGTLTIGDEALGFSDFAFTDLGGLEVTGGTPYKLITSGGISGTLDSTPANLTGTLPGGLTGTLQITGGDVELVVSSGSPYNTWAGGPFQGTLTDTNPQHDFDGGGLATGIEWVVGGDPTKASDDLDKAPTYDNSNANYFLFIYRRSDAALNDPNTIIKVEYGNDLGGWTTAVDGENGITVTPENNFYADSPNPGVDKVIVLIPRTLAPTGKLFVRLNVAVVP